MSTASLQRAEPRVGASFGEHPQQARLFWTFKRFLDICVSLLALPIVAVAALGLMLLNPFANRGPLLFCQRRMGQNQRDFVMYKFRTMTPTRKMTRGPADPLETDRITPLGAWLRRLRIDERGDMSLVGPRPDYIEHARDYAENVPSYRQRFVIRPGISGYAQVRLGYAEGYDLAETKAQLDIFYIRNAGWRLESWILLRTLGVLLTGHGAR
jgi:lipopolysaccharide/colanic/teichoic acid biosynthesis glycosyltransferase